MTKIYTSDEAAKFIQSDCNLLVDGSGGGVNEPGDILLAIEKRFLETGQPRNLTVIHPSGMGDHRGGGIDRLAHEGLTRKVIGGHWGWSDRMQELALNEKIAGYCLPQGVISHLLRAIAGGQPGIVTRVGLGTFVDPRNEHGRLNASATESLLELVNIAGNELLFYHTFPIHIALIRGTTADESGNITMEHEGLFAETLSAAQAVKNSGGIVLAQVKRIVETGTIDPRQVKVPGILVDAIVVSPEQALSIGVFEDPSLWGEARVGLDKVPQMDLTERKIIARRAAMEVRQGDIINLGFGMPDGVASVLAEEGLVDEVTLTLEQGHIGGIPATGVNFGMARNQYAMVDAGYQFDWYDGGGLDITVLSFAEIDAKGNVNVGKFGGRMPGVGGFINISQGAKRVVFVGTLMAGKTQFDFQNGTMQVSSEGTSRKFVANVQQISFSSAYVLSCGKPVTYVTERAVFQLVPEGLLLTEIAPGLDLEQDVLKNIGFVPLISTNLKMMTSQIFMPEKMGLTLAPRQEPIE